MKAFVFIAMLFLQLQASAQTVKDANGLTGKVMDLHVNKTYQLTYVQVVFDFDSVTWGVYLLNGIYNDATIVVAEGNLLKMNVGAGLYPLSDDWKYITKKQFNQNIQSNKSTH